MCNQWFNRNLFSIWLNNDFIQWILLFSVSLWPAFCLRRDRKLTESRFGMTWGWVINYNIFIFVWTIPLRLPADYLQVFYDVDHFSCGVGVGDCSLVSHGPELSECSHQFLEDCIRNVRPILLQHGKLSLRFGVVHCMAAKYVPWKSKSSNHQKYFKQYYIIVVTVLQCFLRSLTLIGQSCML